jgi:hypothetical protein
MPVQLQHIDTCLACYLQDHHNRPGEHLAGVVVDGTTTYAEVRATLERELTACGPEDDDAPTDAEICVAVAGAFSTVRDLEATFDSSLEVNESDRDWDEPVQAWFLMTWDVETREAVHSYLQEPAA